MERGASAAASARVQVPAKCERGPHRVLDSAGAGAAELSIPGRRVPGLPQADFSSPAMAEELRDLLREFDEVMEDFDRGPTPQYEQHLEELKRKAGTRVYDSGIDELESDLNSSEEDLNTPASAYPSKGEAEQAV
uniref:Uncharacterized protein n=1 Tax=Melopsittacus undulatus TaxID=13146 RepID=A0A8C6NFA1_MELUD